MADFTREQATSLRENILRASVQSSERCLYQSAKWLAELASSLPPPADFASADDTDSDSPMRDVEPPIPGLQSIFSTPDDPEESRLEAQEFGNYLLAKSYFDCREFDRCSAVFLPSNPTFNVLSSPPPESPTQTPTKAAKGKAKTTVESPAAVPKPPSDKLPPLSQKSLFLALYAKYIAGEKRKDEDSEMILGPMDNGAVANKELAGIGRTLEAWFDARRAEGKEAQNQGWLEYLYGIVLAKGNSDAAAKQYLVKAINVNPWNWGAWLELKDLLNSQEALRATYPLLPHNILTLLFNIDASQSLYLTSPEIHSSLTELLRIFPTSAFLLTQRALLHYHTKSYDEASAIFSLLIQRDPHRLDALDHYSNVLYVMSNRPRLAFLAQLATATDKFRPETCCIVGNYYSLKSEHEKAVMYFRRALTLDRAFLSAWTLMGHEYVEVKNTHAAIEAYRRAVDVNRKDYRAWYGLGQAYEVLEMHHYALFYFQRAAALRSYDRQMWQALGACYEKIDRPAQAIKAYKRALTAGMAYIEPASSSFGSTTSFFERTVFLDPDLLYPIALMYERLGEPAETASYMELVLAQEEGPADPDAPPPQEHEDSGGQGTGVTLTTSKARLWLARWAHGRGEVERAMELANELCEDGYEVEEAKALIRDLRARMEAGG
ncbi:MAG: hypothetical protein LQ344_004834 [Seirophora lacunosa]|nr:MAG: hypothetical protein LQ344_004834 [Seirophora lacunosa]